MTLINGSELVVVVVVAVSDPCLSLFLYKLSPSRNSSPKLYPW